MADLSARAGGPPHPLPQRGPGREHPVVQHRVGTGRRDQSGQAFDELDSGQLDTLGAIRPGPLEPEPHATLRRLFQSRLRQGRSRDVAAQPLEPLALPCSDDDPGVSPVAGAVGALRYADADGQITLDELDAVGVATLGYEVGQYSEVTTLAGFVSFLTQTIGHVDGEGHCQVDL